MTTMDAAWLIKLNDGWTCDYLEFEPDLYEFMQPEAVVSLDQWSFDRRRVHGWVAFLRRELSLPPLAGDRHVYLYIDSAPVSARIYANQRLAGLYVAPGDDDPPFELDLTALVNDGRNQLAFRVDGEARGRFEGISLQVLATEKEAY